MKNLVSMLYFVDAFWGLHIMVCMQTSDRAVVKGKGGSMMVKHIVNNKS